MDMDHEELIHEDNGKEDAVVRPPICRRLPEFSNEELKFTRAAIDNKRLSQAHFTDPGPDYCYRCPLCIEALDGETLHHQIKIRLGMLRRGSSHEYNFVIYNAEASKNFAPFRETGGTRCGPEPPTEASQEHHGQDLPLPAGTKGRPTGTWQNGGPADRDREEEIEKREGGI